MEEARRSLAQMEGDVTEHATGSRAGEAVQEEKRAKARIAADLARRNIDSMTVTAPIAGLVVPRSNQNAANGFFYTGMTLPDFREGDTANPGQVIADIVDLSEMEIRAKVPETERPLLTPGAPTQVEMEALPAAPLAGTAKGVAGLAQHSMWDTGTSRQFDAAFALDHPVPAFRPGMTARLVVQGETLSNVMHLPRQALFERNGKPVVYVAEGAGFKPVEVQVVRMTETRVVLRDFPADADVALVDPESRNRRAKGPSAGRATAGGDAMTGTAPAGAGTTRLQDPGGLPARVRDPDDAQAAVPADDAGDDLRCGGGRVDDVDRRGRSAAGAGLHRAAGRRET